MYNFQIELWISTKFGTDVEDSVILIGVKFGDIWAKGFQVMILNQVKLASPVAEISDPKSPWFKIAHTSPILLILKESGWSYTVCWAFKKKQIEGKQAVGVETLILRKGLSKGENSDFVLN